MSGAIVIGAVGGVLCTFGIKLLESLKVDDVVGAVPAHLFAGVWGTLAVCIAAGGDLVVQLTGIVSIGVFVFTFSGWCGWFWTRRLALGSAPPSRRWART